MRRIMTIIMCLLLTVPALAQQIIITKKKAASSCSLYVTNTGEVASGAELYADGTYKAEGQSFTGDGKVLCKIYFYVTELWGSAAVKIRVGASTDLSTVYLGEVTPTVSESGEVTADFESQDITLTSETTYYYIVSNTASGYANRVRIGYIGSNDYAGGTHYGDCTAAWTGCSANAGYDAYFMVDTK